MASDKAVRAATAAFVEIKQAGGSEWALVVIKRVAEIIDREMGTTPEPAKLEVGGMHDWDADLAAQKKREGVA